MAWTRKVDALALALSSLMSADEYLKENAVSSLCISYFPNILDVNQLFSDSVTKDRVEAEI